jgi:predicted DCC family thiol-disulfide oxidoreductase YuxK
MTTSSSKLSSKPPAPSNASLPDCVLIYDDQCRMCVTAKEGIERLGRVNDSVRFVPYGSEEAAQRLGEFYRPGRPAIAFLVGRDGAVSQGLDAFIPLLPGLKGGRLLRFLLRLPLGRAIGHLLYRTVARNRYKWFGAVPRPDVRSGPANPHS